VRPHLCKAGVQLRNQIDDCYAERDRRSDGWIGDAKHAGTKSDHNPALPDNVVRALDVDSDLSSHKSESIYLANQIRLYAKREKPKRIAYIIHSGKIASPILNWRWRKYTGSSNPHTSHIHISFTPKGDKDGSFFEIPMLGGNK
jgi:hypothetical protein